MRFKVMSKSMKALVLAGALSLAAASAAQAGCKPTGMDFHASAVPADDTGQNVTSDTARSGQIPTLWRPVLADNGSAGGMNDDNGGSTEGGRGGISGEV
jgi:hypothetical protein